MLLEVRTQNLITFLLKSYEECEIILLFGNLIIAEELKKIKKRQVIRNMMLIIIAEHRLLYFRLYLEDELVTIPANFYYMTCNGILVEPNIPHLNY